jgi:hypothetical protein
VIHILIIVSPVMVAILRQIAMHATCRSASTRRNPSAELRQTLALI